MLRSGRTLTGVIGELHSVKRQRLLRESSSGDDSRRCSTLDTSPNIRRSTGSPTSNPSLEPKGAEDVPSSKAEDGDGIEHDQVVVREYQPVEFPSLDDSDDLSRSSSSSYSCKGSTIRNYDHAVAVCPCPECDYDRNWLARFLQRGCVSSTDDCSSEEEDH